MTLDPADDRETLRIQMQQSIETIRHLTSLFVQAIGFFTASNVLLLGYGLTQRKSGAILVAALMPLAVLSAQAIIYRNAVPIGYVALRCERKLTPGEVTLAITYLRTQYNSLYVRLISIMEMEPEAQLTALRTTRMPFLRSSFNLWYFSGAIAQLVVFVLAQTVFNYHLI
jgi:hypothetical protein